ncbi:protein phosphatase 1 regulatory subunit 3E [Carcharodon carcharias]|uniref:protein phosphatase 1 regulatory subunit 3E n=1 Tax=Carcharodon carcharias TaxID=13397 RepID=UPI001B7F2B31|nr:protein phosphatase 1 regulatory subunit 3E [Carcharodon carcharias]
MEKAAVQSGLCMPRNFSCVAGLYGSLAGDCAVPVPVPAPGAGDAELPEGCKRKGQCEKPRSREGGGTTTGTTTTTTTTRAPSPGQRRRAKSLPAPGDRAATVLTRARSKKVRFADSLGLELTTIRHFCDADVPQIPQRVMARLRGQPPGHLLSNETLAVFLDGPAHLLEPLFSNPCGSPNFQQRVRLDRVCLERISTDQFSILGVVRVWNVAYEKQVLVRYTLNQWKSFMDIAASHAAHWADSQTDTFSFKLVAPVFLDTGGTLQFAIRYLVAGQEYWDNNRGSDYQVRSHKFKISPPKEWENGWIHFI